MHNDGGIKFFAKSIRYNSTTMNDNENLDTTDSIVDHPRVVEPKHIRGWLGDVLHNAHLENNSF